MNCESANSFCNSYLIKFPSFGQRVPYANFAKSKITFSICIYFWETEDSIYVVDDINEVMMLN